MNTKNVLTALGLLCILQCIAIFMGAADIMETGFTSIEMNDTAMTVGIIMHEAMAASFFMLAMILLFCRDLEPAAGAKVLTGYAVGTVGLLAMATHHLMNSPADPPMPLLVLNAVLIIVAFVTAKKATA